MATDVAQNQKYVFENGAFEDTDSREKQHAEKLEPIVSKQSIADQLLCALENKDFKEADQILSDAESVKDQTPEEMLCSMENSGSSSPVFYCATHVNEDQRYMSALKRLMLLPGNDHVFYTESRTPASGSKMSVVEADDLVFRIDADLQRYQLESNKAHLLYNAMRNIDRGRSFDPFLTSFELAHRLSSVLGKKYKNLRREYQEMGERVNEFSADLLGCVKSERELDVVIGGGSPTEDPLALLRQAVKYKHKHLPAHYLVEEKVGKVWFGEKNLPDPPDVDANKENGTCSKSRHLPSVNWKTAVLLAVLTPFFWVSYLIWPLPKVKRWLEIPVRKFYADCMMMLTFIALLIVWAGACEYGSFACRIMGYYQIGTKCCTYVRLSSGRPLVNLGAKHGYWHGYNESVDVPTGDWNFSSVTKSSGVSSGLHSWNTKETTVTTKFRERRKVPAGLPLPEPRGTVNTPQKTEVTTQPSRKKEVPEGGLPLPEPHETVSVPQKGGKQSSTTSILKCFPHGGHKTPLRIRGGLYKRNATEESSSGGCFEARRSALSSTEWVITLFAIGLLVNEINEFLACKKEYLRSFINFVDVAAQLGYITGMICHYLAIKRTLHLREEYENRPVLMLHQGNITEADATSKATVRMNTVLMREANANELSAPYDLDRVGGCLLAVATVLFLIHSLQLITEWHVLGRIYIALDKLLKTIMPWFLLFIWLMSAFAISMHTLMWDFFEITLCQGPDREINHHMYRNTLRRTLGNFLWAVFGHTSPNALHWIPKIFRTQKEILHSYKLHIITANALLGFYNLFIVMVFLNLVIAVVNDMYNMARRRQEWQFHRLVQRLKYIPVSKYAPRFIVPPPLNLVPVWHHFYDLYMRARALSWLPKARSTLIASKFQRQQPRKMSTADAGSGYRLYYETARTLLDRLEKVYKAKAAKGEEL